jgi:predicted HicB family RNase H-like nuclease
VKGEAIMKWVKDGVSYNTATSTPLAKATTDDDGEGKNFEGTLYKTRGGAFFVHAHREWAVKREGEWVEKESNDCVPMTADEAQRWVEDNEAEVHSDEFEMPPEASAESTPSATIYLRVPNALKRQIERAADKADQSLNEWAMRCLERCAQTAR